MVVLKNPARLVKGLTHAEYERIRWHTLPEEKKQSDLNKLKSWSSRQTPEYMYFLYLRKRARRDGIEFNLTPEDIVFPKVCPVLGTPIRPTGGKKTMSSPSCDRMDNNRGYLKDNIMMMSSLANTMKNKANPEELLKFADWVYKNYKNN